MERRAGGISIFLAIVYLSLIVFSCSIIELTRYQVGRIQAERALFSASQSVLGGYDRALKERYGIFARSTYYGDVQHIETKSLGKGSDFLIQDLHHYISEYIINDPNLLDKSMVDQLAIQKDNAHFDLINLKLREITVTYPEKLVHLETRDLEYVKQDMLKYMDYRAPLLTLAPFIEKLDVMEKMGKTAKFIQGKNAQVAKAEALNESYTKLYTLIDGLYVNKKAQRIFTKDITYVKRLLTNLDEVTYGEAETYIAGGNRQSVLEERQMHIPNVVDLYDANMNLLSTDIEIMGRELTTYNEQRDSMVELEADKKSLEVEIETLQIELRLLGGTLTEGDKNEYSVTMEASIQKVSEEGGSSKLENLKEAINDLSNRITDIDSEIAKLEGEIKKVEEAIRTIVKKIDQIHEENINVLKQIRLLTQSEPDAEEIATDVTNIYNQRSSYYSGARQVLNRNSAAQGALVDQLEGQDLTKKARQSYLKCNQAVLEIIENIHTSSIELGESIDEFINESQSGQADYIDSTYTQSVKELNTIKENFGLDCEKENFEDADNINLMKDIVKVNIQTLESVAEFINKLEDAYQVNLYTKIKENQVDETLVATIMLQADEPNILLTYLEEEEAKNKATQLTMTVEKFRNRLKAYSTQLYFDYSGYVVAGQENTSTFYEDVVGLIDGFSVEGLFKNQQLKKNPIVDTAPSVKLGFTETNTDIKAHETLPKYKDKKLDATSGNNYFESVSLIENVKENLTEAREQIFLNEYAIGMFSTYADRWYPKRTTLSGIPKKEHVMNTEVEYILTGIRDAEAAVEAVGNKILVIRIVANIIHLMSNGAKRTAIINLATLLGAWIPANLGTIIFTIILTLLWATAEGVVDLMLLTMGQKVPLIKTTASWYLSPEGMAGPVRNLAGDGLAMAEEIGHKLIKETEKKVKEVVGEIETSLHEETKKAISATITTIYQEGKDEVAAVVQTAENRFYDEVDRYLTAYKNKETYTRPKAFSQASVGKVLTNVLSKLEKELGEEAGYRKIIEAKKRVLEEMSSEIEEMKTAIEGKMTKEVDKKIADYTKKIKKEISENSQMAHEALTLRIKKESDQFLKNTERIKGETSTVASDGLALSDFIPSFSYQDYIRIFMLIESDKLDARVARMLDLIELNMAQYKGETYHLSDHIVSMDAVGTFTMDAYMFLMPFLKYRNTAEGKAYIYRVEVVNGYE